MATELGGIGKVDHVVVNVEYILRVKQTRNRRQNKVDAGYYQATEEKLSGYATQFDQRVDNGRFTEIECQNNEKSKTVTKQAKSYRRCCYFVS